MNSRQQPAVQLPFLSQPPRFKNSTNNAAPDASTTPNREHGRSNASRLREYRTYKGAPGGNSHLRKLKESILGNSHINESLLVRDTLYLMQGISGKYVRFAVCKEEEKKIVFNTDSVSTLYIISYIAHLLAAQYNSCSNPSINSPLGRTGPPLLSCWELCQGTRKCTRRWHDWAEPLPLSSSTAHRVLSTDRCTWDSTVTKRTARSYISWRYKYDRSRNRAVFEETWCLGKRLAFEDEDDERLRWRCSRWEISLFTRSKFFLILDLDAHGGALVNLIHSYTDNGDPFVRNFTDELLEEASYSAGY